MQFLTTFNSQFSGRPEAVSSKERERVKCALE